MTWKLDGAGVDPQDGYRFRRYISDDYQGKIKLERSSRGERTAVIYKVPGQSEDYPTPDEAITALLGLVLK